MAQRGLNKVSLIGKLGQNPEIKELENGKMATISVATSETWKDKQGEKQEATEWHRVTIFGSAAGFVETYAEKGTQVFIEAQLKTRKWKDATSGEDKYSLDIVVKDFSGSVQILSQPQKNEDGTKAPSAPKPAPKQAPSAPQSAPPLDEEDDDVPF